MRGFTLVELLVVILLIAILAGIAIPGNIKTVETGKANQAVTALAEVGTAHRMWDADGNAWLLGLLTNACNNQVCGFAANPQCDLVRCNLLAKRDWSTLPYSFSACDTAGGASGVGSCQAQCCGANAVACACRKTGASPGTSASPYNGWFYRMNANGVITVGGGAPPP